MFRSELYAAAAAGGGGWLGGQDEPTGPDLKTAGEHTSSHCRGEEGRE